MIEMLLEMDGNILLFIQEFIRNPILTPFFKVVTSLGNAGILWILLSVILLSQKKTRKTGWMCACALLGSLIINNLILKNLVGRIRPYEVIEGLVPLIKKPMETSFPSGHTASSFAAACILYRKLPKKFGVPALILAVLIGFSRLYVGVHYPSDVLFGMISGIGISFLAEFLVNYISEQRGTALQ